MREPIVSRYAAGQLSPSRRAADLARLREQRFDVLVIGGGVTGVGAALDAAARGLSVALVEARDLAAGTSSRSSKLIHGGLRYLEQFEFGLVREALRERGLLVTRLAPHLVRPVPILVPLSDGGQNPVGRAWHRAYYGAGVALYDGFEVGDAAQLAEGALVVSATGVPASITRYEWRNAVAAAVAGGVPGELDLDGAELVPVAPHLDRAGNTLILDRGGCINITAAEGNPIEIMDLSFATQLAALAHLLEARPGIGVFALPPESVDRVAQAALRSRGLTANPATASGRGEDDWRSLRYR